MQVPMREKYIDEATGGVWFIFGARNDGTVDVSDGNRDVFTGVPKDVAKQLIHARDRFLHEVYEILKGA